MHIHIGQRTIVSDASMIGIFNAETILLSEENRYYFKFLNEGDKTLVIDRNNNAMPSIVSSFTLTKRTYLKDGFIWRRENDERI